MKLTDSQFAEFVATNNRKFYITAKNNLRNISDAEDAVQLTFIKLWQNLDTFKQDCKLTTFAYYILRNVIIDIVRSRDSQPDYITQTPEGNCVFDSIAQADADNETDLDAIYLAVDKLSKTNKEALELYIGGFSYQEVSDKLGISLANVKVRINRARVELKQIIASN